MAITGTGFIGVTAVKFGDVDASSFTVDSATQITAITPAHPEGRVDVSVTAESGVSYNTSADDYFYSPEA